MTVAIGNKRLPVTLDDHRKKEPQKMKEKYHKSESKIMCVALDLLIEQEKSGFEIPSLKSDVTFKRKQQKCYHFC